MVIKLSTAIFTNDSGQNTFVLVIHVQVWLSSETQELESIILSVMHRNSKTLVMQHNHQNGPLLVLYTLFIGKRILFTGRRQRLGLRRGNHLEWSTALHRLMALM